MSQKQASYTTRKFHDPLDDLLDRPISFNPAFKKITGSTVAALMLSQAWYWSKRTSNEEGWFYKIGVEWEEETGLSRSEQETARRILGNLGIMEEDLRGVPATLYYRIDKPKIYSLMGVQFAGIPQTEIVETQQTRMLESSKQDSDILANINRTDITSESTSLGVPPKIETLSLENQIFAGVEKVTLRDEVEERRLKMVDMANLIDFQAPGAGALAFAFMQTRGIIFTEKQVKAQRNKAKELLDAGVTPKHVIEATKAIMTARQKNGKTYTCADLFSIEKTAISISNPLPSQFQSSERNPMGI